ncbi:MAG: sterol desaturase family protein [Hyphomonadaceae bacterium]|nr:sterol desaturase family protein [Hyphomonadaceae bacterium]
MTPADLLFLSGTAAALIVLERLLPLHPGQVTLRAGWMTDILHVFVSGAMIRFGASVTTVGASLLAVSLAPESIREAVRSQPDVLEFIELLILSDLCFYAAHRLCHAVPFLWRFHAVHHSSETMDWLATYRVHPVDQILNSAMIALPAIVLGFSPGVVIAYALIYRLHAPLLHSNVRIELGPLRHVLATPQYHHWHHGDHPEAYDKNFAGQLAFIDRLFGTYHSAGDRTVPARYGVSGGIPKDYVGQLLQPFGWKRPVVSPPQPPAQLDRA